MSTPPEGSTQRAKSLVEAAGGIVGRDPVKAAELFEDAAELALVNGDIPRSAGAYERAAWAWALAGNTVRALEAFDRGSALLPKIADPATRLAVATNLAVALGHAGFDERAVGLLDLALERLSVAKSYDHASAAMLLLNVAVSETRRGRFEEARTRLAEAATEASKASDQRLHASILYNEGVTLSAMGLLREARAAYSEALRVYEASSAPAVDKVHALRGLAATVSKTGRYEDAVELYERALELLDEQESREVLATLIGLIMCQHKLGILTLDQLDDIQRRLAHQPPELVGQMSRNIGNIRLDMGDFEGAEAAYTRARSAFQVLQRPHEVASVDSNRAVAARRRGNLERARRLLYRVRRTQSELGNWLSVANADINLALVTEELADRSSPPSATLLAAGARRVLRAIESVNELRHSLGTPTDRSSLFESVYGELFPTGMRLAYRARDAEKLAALTELARVQPVLIDESDDRPFQRPLPVVARRSRRTSRPEAIALADEAARIAGDGAAWIGWFATPDEVVTSVTNRSGAYAFSRDRRDEVDRLAAALPVPLPEEDEAAGQHSIAQQAALYRALRGALVDDPRTASLVADTLPANVLSVATAAGGVKGLTDDAQLLWPLSQLLIPASLRSQLIHAAQDGRPIPLVLAPPPELGRIPWAALPLSSPGDGQNSFRLVEAADLTVGLPASLSAAQSRRRRSARFADPPLLVVDPLGDLRHLRNLQVPGAVNLGVAAAPATRANVLAAASSASLLVLGAHVMPGTPADPASSAIILSHPTKVYDRLTAADLAEAAIPPTCVLLTCDGAGAATGNEWTGIAVGLVWAGAQWVVTTTSPTLDDRVAAVLDQRLVDNILASGPREGLWQWQRDLAAERRTAPTSDNAPLRWATYIATGAPVRKDSSCG